MLANKTTLPRLADMEVLKEVLKSRQKTKARKGNILLGFNRLFQKAPALPFTDQGT